MLAMADRARKQGRPLTRWIDEIKNATGQTLQQLTGDAMERLRWNNS